MIRKAYHTSTFTATLPEKKVIIENLPPGTDSRTSDN